VVELNQIPKVCLLALVSPPHRLFANTLTLDEIKLDDGTIVPMGKGIPTGVAGALLYNEYIVYNVEQAVIRYLLKVKFNFK